MEAAPSLRGAHYSNHQPPSSSRGHCSSSRKRAAVGPKMLRRYDSAQELPLHRERLRAHTDLPHLQVLEDAVHKELKALNGQEELFLRSTTDLSNLLRDLTHEHGRSYFRYVLREVFGDRSRIYSGQTSHADMIAYAQSVLKRLARAIHFAPPVLRAYTQYVLREFQAAFPSCKSSEKIVIGSILFLRILCPALIKPETFGYEPHSAKSLPTGVQLAKLLQCTLRGTLVSANQPEGVASNEFVTAFHPFVVTFLTRFPQLTDSGRELQRPVHVTRFASWDEAEPVRAAQSARGASPVSWRGDESLATRLRGMSLSTHEDLKQRKKKFSLKFWH